jgi:hypothetical protein
MHLPLLAFYAGPEQLAPVASIFATIAGFILIFWNKLLNQLRRIGRFFTRSADKPGAGPTDHRPTGPA